MHPVRSAHIMVTFGASEHRGRALHYSPPGNPSPRHESQQVPIVLTKRQRRRRREQRLKELEAHPSSHPGGSYGQELP